MLGIIKFGNIGVTVDETFMDILHKYNIEQCMNIKLFSCIFFCNLDVERNSSIENRISMTNNNFVSTASLTSYLVAKLLCNL